MSARTRRTRAKAYRLIDFGYHPTYRQLMQSYRFWKRVINKKKIKLPRKFR